MNLIEIYRQIFSEAKQVGDLYHVTTIGKALQILQTNKMKGSKENNLSNSPYTISFTRDKNFIYNPSDYDGYIHMVGYIQFVVDGNKLSTRYKIQPFDYFKTHYTDFINKRSNFNYAESEEIVLTKQIVNFDRYIIRINYKTPKAEKYKHTANIYIQKMKDIAESSGIEFQPI